MREPIRVVIADDEPLAREALGNIVASAGSFRVIGEAANGVAACDLIVRERPDLVFLDIRMPGRDGFEVVEDLLQRGPLPMIIFVTAWDEYAVRAFEVSAIDYVLKPFDDERIVRSLERAETTLRSQASEEVSRRLLDLLERDPSEPSRFARRLMIPDGGRWLFVRVDEIDWIESADYYARIHVGREDHLLRESLQSLSERLDPSRFVRIHRSTIVNIERLRELHPLSKGDSLAVLSTGVRLKVSRARRSDLEKALQK